jgi:hypothetical protein
MAETMINTKADPSMHATDIVGQAEKQEIEKPEIVTKHVKAKPTKWTNTMVME